MLVLANYSCKRWTTEVHIPNFGAVKMKELRKLGGCRPKLQSAIVGYEPTRKSKHNNAFAVLLAHLKILGNDRHIILMENTS